MRSSFKPWAVYGIIGINVLVFIILLITSFIFGGQDPFRAYLTFQLNLLHDGFWWQTLTYSWLHADPLTPPLGFGVLHILFNMGALWMFGPEVERRMGKLFFLILYFVGGIVSAWSFVLEYWIRCDFSWLALAYRPEAIVGASGAVMSIIAAFTVIRPDVNVYLFFIPYPIKAFKALIIFCLISFLLLFVPFVSFIGHSAHLGGALAGYLGIFLYNKFVSKKNDSISINQVHNILLKKAIYGVEALTDEERELMERISQNP
jgi:membrane associated rhomboid family serine protease